MKIYEKEKVRGWWTQKERHSCGHFDTQIYKFVATFLPGSPNTKALESDFSFKSPHNFRASPVFAETKSIDEQLFVAVAGYGGNLLESSHTHTHSRNQGYLRGCVRGKSIK